MPQLKTTDFAPPLIKLTLLVRKNESGEALATLYKALEFHSYNDYQLSIVDVMENPHAARCLGVIHTPVIVRHLDDGKVLYCRNLADLDQIRENLGFRKK